MAEVLAPARLDIAQEFARGFEGMTETTVTLDELLRAREQAIAELVGTMPKEHRRFLVSVKTGNPEWGLLGLPHVENLPAVQWRLQNLAKADATKRKRELLVGNLAKALKIESDSQSVSHYIRIPAKKSAW